MLLEEVAKGPCPAARRPPPPYGIIVNRARHRIARTDRPAQRTGTARPHHGADLVCGGLELGGGGGQAGSCPCGVLAGRDFAFLRSACRGCDLPEPDDAVGRRPLSVGEIRLWRSGRLSYGVEPVGLCSHCEI